MYSVLGSLSIDQLHCRAEKIMVTIEFIPRAETDEITWSNQAISVKMSCTSYFPIADQNLNWNPIDKPH